MMLNLLYSLIILIETFTKVESHLRVAMDWVYNSVVEYLLGIHKALASKPSITKNNLKRSRALQYLPGILALGRLTNLGFQLEATWILGRVQGQSEQYCGSQSQKVDQK